MKAYEVSKNKADIQRGRVMMAIEGATSAVEAISKALETEGYISTNCADTGDNEGEIIEYFMISRADKSGFMSAYKLNK